MQKGICFLQFGLVLELLFSCARIAVMFIEQCGVMCSLDPSVNFIAVCVCVEVFAYLQGSHQAMFGKLGNY